MHKIKSNQKTHNTGLSESLLLKNLKTHLIQRLRQTEDAISLVCTRNEVSILTGIRSYPAHSWSTHISEENFHSLFLEEQGRRLTGNVPKEILTVLFLLGWRTVVNVAKATKGQSTNLTLTNDLFNLYSNDPKLLPRSTYRKNVGDGVRTITYWVVPERLPYLCITIVLLTDGESLLPHMDIQNHGLFKNATTSFGDWTGGVLQIDDNGTWIDQDFRETHGSS